MAKRDQAPAVAVAGLYERDLAEQTFQDWRVVSPALVSDFAPFEKTPGRYLLVVLAPDVVQRQMRGDARLLLRLVVDTELRGLWMNLVTVGPGEPGADRTVVAVLVAALLLLDHPACPQTQGGFVADLVTHVAGLSGRSEIGETQIGTNRCGGPTVTQLLTRRPAPSGYYSIPEAWSSTCLAAELRAAIYLPPETSDRPVTFRINDFYGHSGILRTYCGVSSGLPVHGQVQHGWTPPRHHAVVGQDPEQDMALLWSSTAFAPDQRHVQVIGAPYLYLPEVPDPGPVKPGSLLAVPAHGISMHPIQGSWADYADWLQRTASARGFSSTTVCLHPCDWGDETVAVFEERGIRAVTCRTALNHSYLHRMRAYIRQHAAVTTNRVGTPAFYALYENRALVLDGPLMGTDPPDRGEELTGDVGWTREHYPALFENGPAAHELALHELGARYKRTPAELRSILFGWYFGKAAT